MNDDDLDLWGLNEGNQCEQMSKVWQNLVDVCHFEIG